MRFWTAHSDTAATSRRPSADVFICAGLGIDRARSERMRDQFSSLKKHFGLPADAPVRHDIGSKIIRGWFSERDAEYRYEAFLERFDDFRFEAFRLLIDHDCFLLGAASEGRPDEPGSPNPYGYGARLKLEAFTSLLRRLAALAGKNLVALETPRVVVFTDRHGGCPELARAYEQAWLEGHRGLAPGELQETGFAAELEVRETLHNPFLQLADLVTGLTRDFFDFCFDRDKSVRSRIVYFFSELDRLLHSEPALAVGTVSGPADLPLSSGLHISPRQLNELALSRYTELARELGFVASVD